MSTETPSAIATPAAPQLRRSAFSLRTLLLFVLLCGSSATLWWHWSPWVLEHTLVGHSKTVTDAQFSPDGQRVITKSNDRSARVWDIETGRQIAEFNAAKTNGEWHPSPDARRIVTIDLKPSEARLHKFTEDIEVIAQLWDAETGKQIAQLNDVVFGVFSRDGRLLFTTSFERRSLIWDAQTGRQVSELTGLHEKILNATFSPDGKRLVSVSKDKTARLWDCESGRQLIVFTEHRGPVFSATFSSDCRRIATGSEDKTVRVWNADSGGQLLELGGHEFTPTAVFSSNGRFIVTTSREEIARVWNASTGEQISALKGHTDRITAATFSADSRYIVTESQDNTARVWETDTGRELFSLTGHKDWIFTAAFSPDGRRIVTGSRDATARIWIRRRPEHALGVLVLPEFWLTCVLFIGTICSVWQDQRLRAK